jgi:hypothetical protein
VREREMIYIYIYIERERERERRGGIELGQKETYIYMFKTM